VRRAVPFIDWLRAIAPAIVMWAHLGPMSLWLFGKPWLPWAWSQSSFDTLHITEGGGHLGVLLFFLASGFIISYVADQETRAEFATKRIFRIFPMLFVGSAIAFVLSRLIPGELFSFRDMFLSASLLDHMSTTQKLLTVTWSLVPEVGFYALMIAFFDPIMRHPVNSTYVLIGSLFASQVVLCWVFDDTVLPAVYFLKQALFIMIGRAAYLVWSGRASRASGAILAGVAISALAASDFLTPYSRSQLFSTYSVAFSWAYALAIFGAAMMVVRLRTPPIFHFLSNVSYSTYLLHFPIGKFLIFFLAPLIGGSWAVLVAVTAVYGASYLTYRTIEVPGQRVGRAVISALGYSNVVASTAH
jgi:exopolysaccharide production protein ExoZ